MRLSLAPHCAQCYEVRQLDAPERLSSARRLQLKERAVPMRWSGPSSSMYKVRAGPLPEQTSTVRVLAWRMCKGSRAPSLCITFASDFDLHLGFCPCRPLARVHSFSRDVILKHTCPSGYSSYTSCFWMALVTVGSPSEHFGETHSIRNDGICYVEPCVSCMSRAAFLVLYETVEQ
jgi:hypothetical protein